MIRRVSALTLVLTLTTIGVPVPANASGEQEQPSAPNSVLTLNGQPIRQFISTTGRSRDAFSFAGLTPGGLGTLRARQAVRTNTSDPLWNGIAIGAAVGAGSGLLAVAAYCGSLSFPDSCRDPYQDAAETAGWWGAIGAGVGLLVDFLR